MRDLPEARQDADATEVFPATRAFPVTGESPTAGAPSAQPAQPTRSAQADGFGGFAGPGGPGAGWFGGSGSAGAPAGAEVPHNAAQPSSDADETEILGSRIGRNRIGGSPVGGSPVGADRTDRGRVGDPFGQGRITWGGTNQAGAKPNEETPAPTRTSPTRPTPAGKGPEGTATTGTDQTGTAQTGTGPDADRTDVLPAAPVAPAATPTRVFPTTAPGPATAALRDPWQDTPDADADAVPAAGDHTHDPHEVTVQLDAVQLGDGVIRRADSGHRKSRPERESDGPVFVDASGRRSRLYRRLGIAVGVACAVYAVVIVSTLLSGNSNAPWLPVEGQQEGKPAGQVDTTPLPSQSARPSGTGSAAPQVSPSVGTGVTTAPGADAPAPGASDTARQPGTSADPEPSETGAGTQPGGGGATDPDPTQSTQAPPPATTDPSTPAGGGDPTVDPTAPTVDPTTGTDPGGDTAANGASDPLSAAGPADEPVVAGPDTTLTSPSLSPENTL
ncbi:hypothetical protein [Streptomyces sp. NPDC056405]|uniref:hypothetical protein n=1 Tax=Streptomyces sp. NPDC056405 TaxID=3345811 RepID=UPI0035E07521